MKDDAIAGEAARVDEEGLLKLVDMIESGRYLEIPEPDGSRIWEALKELSRRQSVGARKELEAIVGGSMEANETVFRGALLRGDIAQMEDEAKQLAAASGDVVETVRRIHGAGSDARENARSVKSATAEGRAAVAESTRIMASVSDTVSEAMKRVAALEHASEQMVGLIGNIEAIAKQTHMLSLNAKIEAARAGEAGKGFGVVALEVKNLAGETASATDDIRARIGALKTEISAIVAAMTKGREAVDQGVEVVGRTGEKVERIDGLVGAIGEQIETMAQSLAHQTQVSEEMAASSKRTADMAVHSSQTLQQAIRSVEVLAKGMIAKLDHLATLDIPGKTPLLAKSDHIIWKRRVAEVLSGQLDPANLKLSDHHGCRLGKWYDSQTNPAITQSPAFQRLIDPHKRVHAHGIASVEAVKRKDFKTAVAELNLMEAASLEVIACLDEIIALH